MSHIAENIKMEISTGINDLSAKISTKIEDKILSEWKIERKDLENAIRTERYMRQLSNLFCNCTQSVKADRDMILDHIEKILVDYETETGKGLGIMDFRSK